MTSTYHPDSNFETLINNLELVESSGVNLKLIVVEDSNEIESELFVRDKLEKSTLQRFSLIVNSTNLGQHASLYLGLSKASLDSEFVAIMDGDGEENPLDLIEMRKALQASPDSNIIFAKGQVKKSFTDRLFSSVFHKIFFKLAQTKYSTDVFTIRLFRVNLLADLLSYTESDLNLGALFANLSKSPLYFETIKNSKNWSSYSFTKKLSIALRNIVSFSDSLLMGISYLTFAACSGTLIAIIYYAINYAVSAKHLAGFTTLILALLIFASFTFAILGIMTAYLSVLVKEVKRRPRVHRLVMERKAE